MARLSRFLEAGHFAEKNIPLTLAAWQGTTFQILECLIMGSIEEDENTIARFLV